MIILLSTLLIFLLFLWFIFVYSFKVKIFYSMDMLIIYILKLPIISLKNEKLIDLYKKIIPKDKKSASKDIDYSSILSLIHVDKIDFFIHKQFIDYSLLIKFLLILKKAQDHLPLNNISLRTNISKKEEFIVEVRIRFNLGIILLNILRLRRIYHGKKFD